MKKQQQEEEEFDMSEHPEIAVLQIERAQAEKLGLKILVKRVDEEIARIRKTSNKAGRKASKRTRKPSTKTRR